MSREFSDADFDQASKSDDAIEAAGGLLGLFIDCTEKEILPDRSECDAARVSLKLLLRRAKTRHPHDGAIHV